MPERIPEKIKVAIAQTDPVYLNLEASISKAARIIERAAKEEARLVVFGETWLPGYPAWLDYSPGAALWNHEPTKNIFAQLRQNSIVIPSRESRMLGSIAREHAVVLVIGVNERVAQGPGNGTLYNSLLTFGSHGEILNHHRKLVPTYTERLVWGHGDGDGLKSVETSAGRVGGLICWEHWMPLARQALHISGEQIHIAVWPTAHEMHQIACRHYAFEARCFVLAAGLLMKQSDMPQEMPMSSELTGEKNQFLLRGGSAIIGPDGSYLVEPVFDEERIITSELDFTSIDKERMTLDVSGHYYRPDIFEMSIQQNSRGG